jgi:hypothetical protein
VSSPTPEQILDFHASQAAQQRLNYLMSRCLEGSLSEAEQMEMDEVSQTNYLIVMLKAKAQQALKTE